MTAQAPPLDIEYNLSPEEVNLLKPIVGIQDDEELKRHVIEVRSEAYSVYPYACIRAFHFVRFRITKHPAYQHALKLGKEREGAIFLELPCCVGGDSRAAILDGYPKDNVLASDLFSDYWKIGHKLFKTTPEAHPVPFLQGDIFDPSFLRQDVPPLSSPSEIVDKPPPLKSLTSLTPLQHHVSVIYTAAFFHLFEEDKQRQLAFLFASLLSPLPGSIIFGSHTGASDSDDDKLGKGRLTFRGEKAFAHSPTTWEELWTGKDGPFKPDQVSIKVEVVERDRRFGHNQPFQAIKTYHHVWSITRI